MRCRSHFVLTRQFRTTRAIGVQPTRHCGQGPATEVAEAHETTLAWEQPILPAQYLQASCGSCHHQDIKETPQLARGRELLSRLNCQGCHKLSNIKKPFLGPDLSSVGYKVSREWIYRSWLKEPRNVVDKDGNVTVNGYESGDESRMPQFRLKEEEIKALSRISERAKGQAA